LVERIDYYYKSAKTEGYRSRAAYKLIELHKKYNLIRKNEIIIDLGCAPGSWCQVAKKFGLNCRIIGVDIVSMDELEGIEFIKNDITKPEIISQLKSIVKHVNLILCDTAPKLVGKSSIDSARCYELWIAALNIATKLLYKDGRFVIKIFHNEYFEEFLNKVKKNFRFVKLYRSKSTRKHSSEIFIIGFEIK